MSRVHFTADTHFGHLGIIAACGRPWSDVRGMDEGLIAGWNAVVSPGDVVWHLGDFAHKGAAGAAQRIFARLKGEKHLIHGNHDGDETLSLPWKSISPLNEIVVDGTRLVVCHYALKTWPGQRREAIQLYGHSHGRLPGTSLSADVGVDCWGYVPVTLDQIRQRLLTQPDPEQEVSLPGPHLTVNGLNVSATCR